jgi:amino-acid N-acetyltransferase
VRALLRRCDLPTAGIDRCAGTLIVARTDDTCIGAVALEPHGDDVLLRSVAVDAAVRGQGIGRALTQAALTLACDLGARNVYLLTETAEIFFARLGFRRVARAEVPVAVRASDEFTTLCPQSAAVMTLARDDIIPDSDTSPR